MHVEKILRNYAAATAETGLSEWTLRAIKRASRGQADTPFTGRLTTRRRLFRWLELHPEFVPTRVLAVPAQEPQSSAPAQPGQGPVPSAFGKSDAQSATSAPHRPSPAVPALQPAPSV